MSPPGSPPVPSPRWWAVSTAACRSSSSAGGNPAGPQFAGNPTYLKTNFWYLVETAVRGVGTTFTVASLWKGGSQIGVSNQQDTTGLSLSQITVGAPIVYKSDLLTETFDFDDVRATNFGLPGSTLVTQGPSDTLVGACTPIAIAFQTSEYGTASAPYTFSFGVADATGSAGFSLDGACTQFSMTASFSVGTPSTPLFMESCGPVSYPLASAPDFLTAGALINIDTSLPDSGASADAGSDAGTVLADAGFAPDAGSDAGVLSRDAGGVDGGVDGGSLDGGVDGGASPGPRAELGGGCDSAGAAPVGLLFAILALLPRSSTSRRSRSPQPGHV